MTESARRGPGGSSPDPSVRARVLDAFADLVATSGLSDTSMDDVAAQAGVSKTTLYTRWPDRRSLIVDGFRHVAGTIPEPPEDISFRDLFDAMIEVTAGDDVTQPRRQLLAELIATAGIDDEVRVVLQANHRRWRVAIEDMVERGVRSGEVPADRDVAMAAEAVMGVVTLRQLIGDLPIDESLADLVWRMLTEDRPY